MNEIPELFATKTCPKCKIAASLLEREGVEFDKVYHEDSPEFAKEHGISQAPTLVVETGDKVITFSDITGVKQFIANKKA